MTDVLVRTAGPEDVDALASLKVAWAQLASEPDDATTAAYAEELREWMAAQGDAVVCRVAVVDGEFVGMAWLVVFERVPNIRDRHRLTGDVQSVFVLPGHRSRGIGETLVRALCQDADERGIPRVTVSANEASAELYQRVGFSGEHLLFERRRGGIAG